MGRRADWWMPDPNTIFEEVLKAASNTRRATDPQTLEHIEKIKATKKRKREERLAEKMARRAAVPVPPKGPNMVDRILRQMDPGAWHGLNDVAKAAGVDKGGANRTGSILRLKRWAERAANPKWDPTPVDPWRLMGGEIREPKWLYRMTADGEARQMGL